MPSNNRADNQYYGKYRECCVIACLNNSPVEYNENYIFTPQEQEQLYKEGKIIADYIGDHKAQYIGNHTATASGDILLDNNETVEIKCVSEGTGTYFNTSIYYFQKFGFDFKKYMKEFGLYQKLHELFSDINISETNNSPVSQKNSSYIRHHYTDLYTTYIVPIDEAMRKQFTSDIVDFFTNHIDKIYEFISDMLNKNTVTSQKTSPDRLIVYNYDKNTIHELQLSNFKDNIDTHIKQTDKGLVIGNIRIAFSWQNGVGLNNPTIRVFLEE